MTHPVDVENLRQLKELIGDDLKDILQTFLDIAPTTLAGIKAAILEENAEALRHQAHTLKGSSANIGATTLPELCLTLENKSKEGITQGQEALLNQISDETDRVIRFLSHSIENFSQL